MPYKIDQNEERCIIIKDNKFIPCDSANSDYNLFLEEIALGKDTVEGVISSELQDAIDNWLYMNQLTNYSKAIQRLAKPIISIGAEEVTEDRTVIEELIDDAGMPYTKETVETVVVQRAIAHAPATIKSLDEEGNIIVIPNPYIEADEKERAEAQAIIDSTPQSVIDAYNA